MQQWLDLAGRALLVAGALCMLGWAAATGMGREIDAFAVLGGLTMAAGGCAIAAAFLVRVRRRSRDREAMHRRRTSRAIEQR